MTRANERDLIRAAMDRILNDCPEHSNGAMTVVALAAEAQVPRNALTQRHPDLKNEFYDRIRTRTAVPAPEQALRDKIAELTELRAADAKEIAQLRTDVNALVRALHQLQAENAQLRRTDARVIPLQSSRDTPTDTS